MKKFLLSLIIIIVLAGLGGYYYVGMMAEKELKESVSEMNLVFQEQLDKGTGVKLAIKNYDRGIFSSHADLIVSMDINVPGSGARPAMRMPSLSYPIKLTIDHGPFIFKTQRIGLGYATASVTVPEKMKGMAKMMFNQSSTMPALHINWYLNFNEDSQINFSVPPFMLEARGDKGTFDWKGLDSNFHVTNKGKKIVGYSLTKGIDFHSQHANLSIGKVRVDYNMTYSPYRIWLGDATFKLPSLNLMVQGKPIVALTNFMMKSYANINNALLNMGMNGSLEKCVVLGDIYGPGELDLLLSGFHAKTFNELQSKMQSINGTNYSPEQKQQMLMALMPDLIQLISNGAALEVRKFHFNLPQGKIDATAKLTAPNDKKIKDPIHLISQLDLVSHVSVPKVLVKSVLVAQAKRKIKENQLLVKQNQRRDNNTAMASGEGAQLNTSSQTNNQTSTPPETGSTQVTSGTDTANQATTQANTATTQVTPVASLSDGNMNSENTILSHQQINQLAEQKGEAQLAKFLSHQLLKEEGNNYVVDLTFNKGHLTINGQPASPDILKQ